ncbi:MAG: hypothetical protein RLZ98_3004 [Pseudomonadota bacterium]|jgi:molecular chaperone IbpA
MRHFDLSPLYRSTIGFDHLANMLDSMSNVANDTGFPPYNIERLGESEYRITMAVAGFSRDDLSLEVKQGVLTVRGEKKPDGEKREFMHRGIAERDFQRTFQLADHVEVRTADLRDGLLHIDLVRNLPEKMKPRRIEIGTAAPTQIEA